MLRALSELFRGVGTHQRAQGPTGRRPSAEPRVECLGERVLLSMDMAPITGVSGFPGKFPPIFDIPYMVGKSVEITGPTGQVGTLTFTWQWGHQFQGTFEGLTSSIANVPGTQEFYAVPKMDVGAYTVTGWLGTPVFSWGSERFSISFSGSGSGMVNETHQYFNDNSVLDHESWGVPDFQKVSFSGGIVETGSSFALSGNVDVQNTGQWMWAADTLPSSDPNHMTYMSEWGPYVFTLSGPMRLTLDNETYVTVSNNPITGP